MAERIAILYELEGPNWLTGLCKDLSGGGLSLVHPRRGKVITLDLEGEWEEESEKDFRLRLANDETSFHFWFAEEHNLYCRVRRVGREIVLEFGMEGCNEQELELIRGLLRRRFLINQKTSIGLVFDPEGASEGVNWDPFFLEGGDKKVPQLTVPVGPFVLGFRREDLEEAPRLPCSVEIEDEGPLGVLSCGGRTT